MFKIFGISMLAVIASMCLVHAEEIKVPQKNIPTQETKATKETSRVRELARTTIGDTDKVRCTKCPPPWWVLLEGEENAYTH